MAATVTTACQFTDSYASLIFTQPRRMASTAASGMEIAGFSRPVTARTVTPASSDIVMAAFRRPSVVKWVWPTRIKFGLRDNRSIPDTCPSRSSESPNSSGVAMGRSRMVFPCREMPMTVKP